jgi:ABC-type taurine transport system ATPase subunit
VLPPRSPHEHVGSRPHRRRPRFPDLPGLPEGAADAEGRVRLARPRAPQGYKRCATSRFRAGSGAVGPSAQRLNRTTLLRLVSGISNRPRARERRAASHRSRLSAGFHRTSPAENVYLNGSIHGLSRARVREVMDEIVAFAELEKFIDLPVRTYSSGMYMRLGFSVAAHIQSDVLLLDEVFAVGDEQFQRKCFGKIAEFKNRGGTILFVSHDA